MPIPETTATPRRVWLVAPAFSMGRAWTEVGPDDDLADIVERAMEASSTSEVIIRQEVRT